MSKSVPHVFFQEFYDLKSYIYVFIPLLVLFWCEFIMGGLLSIIFKTRPHDFCSLHCREAHGHTYNKRVWEIKSNFTSREKEKKKVVLLSTQNLCFSQYLIFKSESFYLILIFLISLLQMRIKVVIIIQDQELHLLYITIKTLTVIFSWAYFIPRVKLIAQALQLFADLRLNFVTFQRRVVI